MEHPQLKVIYPACPFVYDYEKMGETFGAASQELDRNNFLVEVASVGVDQFGFDDSSNSGYTAADSRTQSNAYRLKEMLKYLSDITANVLKLENDNNDSGFGSDSGSGSNFGYSSIRYYRTDQVIDSKIPRYRLDMSGNLTKQLWINLHTVAYDCTKHSTSLDSEMKDVVSWCVVPIIGNVRPVSADSIIFSDILDYEMKQQQDKPIMVKGKMDIRETVSATGVESIIDCSAGQDKQAERMARYSQRNFVKRSIKTKEEKSDVSSVLSSGSNTNLPISFVKPNRSQPIVLTSSTRYNAQNIRSAIMSKYKQYRLKQVPQQTAVHRSMDLRIVNGSAKVAETHNTSLMSRVRFLDRSFSDYRVDDVIISKVNSMYRFVPMTSGRIILDLSEPEYEIPAGLAVYTTPQKIKPTISIDERQLEPPPMLRDPDYVGNKKPEPKPNTKISVVAKRSENPASAAKFVKIEEIKKNQPFWLSRKVVTKEEIEAAKVETGDKVNSTSNSKRKIKAVTKEQDRIIAAKLERNAQRDAILELRRADISTREIGKIGVPDLAFVTVVRINNVLCLTLNCIKVLNITA